MSAEILESEARDTIIAIATPPGRGGIGILRLSGPSALGSVQPLLRDGRGPLEAGRPRFCHLVDPAAGTKLDEALVTYYAAPHSYTGEDVVEISAHGSPVLLDHLLRLLTKRGARLANPGEFTERAFLSGRLDLTQAEAVRDLIEAQTLLQAQVAAQQLGGSLSRRIAPLKGELIALIAVLEAGIDFAEDDTPVVDDRALLARVTHLEAEFEQLEASFARGRIVAEGVTLAIVGRPNAGKSSLFNRLLGHERAIVTAEAGTTRDTVEQRLAIAGIPLTLVDTAGLREAENEAERIGIVRSREAFADAGLVLLVLDAREPLNREEESLVRAAEDRPLLIALNKSDLLPQTSRTTEGQPLHLEKLAPGASLVHTSALTGEGIDALEQALRGALLGETSARAETAMLMNLRQHQAVSSARDAMQSAAKASAENLPHELVLLDLYGALAGLDTLTGTTTADDVLSTIFSTFCIGK